MRVLMYPHASKIRKATDGISQVVKAYFRHLPHFGVELVPPDATSYDLVAAHAGMTGAQCDVSHCHGFYWTADYEAPKWEYSTNAKVIQSVRHAKEVTVPSPWVAEAFQRDMRFTPHVIPHGVNWLDWQHEETCGEYVLWNKNRLGDVCDIAPLAFLAERFPDFQFISTQPLKSSPANVRVTGVVPHDEMKKLVQRAWVYLATTKETFGIGILEAMASGIPILGFAHGGALDLVQHGVNGYLAGSGNLEDLAQGLNYCLQHAQILSENSLELSKAWTWEKVCEQVASVYEQALVIEPPTVAVIIPSFNYADFVGRAVESASRQTYKQLIDIIVVDDGSDDDGATREVVENLAAEDSRIKYVRQHNQGVAVARNAGIARTDTKYICCLDADDELSPRFLAVCIKALEADRSLGLAYTGIKIRLVDGRETGSGWPPPCDFDKQVRGENQVPTCCVFRRKAWERLGGYRQRYAPIGCGTEDAEFWLRIGAYGWGVQKVTEEQLFLYALGGRTTTVSDYEEVDWRVWHPWTQDGKHPFASIASPLKHSHDVRQYDEPVASVIIPVGPGHERQVIDALDSLEAQTFRRWEAIVVDDTGAGDLDLTAYPYVRLLRTADGPQGAGFARNRGVEIARASLLLCLDADDWLYPQALERLLLAYTGAGGKVAVYSDYVGMAVVSQEEAGRLTKMGRLLDFNDDGHAVIRHQALDFNPHEAMRQPNLSRPYTWCMISTLFPTEWFFEVGGFDENMASWEDWDLWVRLAKLGKKFARVSEPLLVYSFYTGVRREQGREIAPELATYMAEKYQLERQQWA